VEALHTLELRSLLLVGLLDMVNSSVPSFHSFSSFVLFGENSGITSILLIFDLSHEFLIFVFFRVFVKSGPSPSIEMQSGSSIIISNTLLQ
jgi:hypothetical protein